MLEDDPHQLIEGMIIAGYAIQATKGIIYIRGEYYKGYERTEQAVIEARKAGYLGKNLFGTDFEFDIILHRGAGAYICGEETALMNSYEGLRANPRLKPPFPAQAGVYSRPTTINNVTSLASAVHIINKGAAWFSNMGSEDSKGTKLYQISGPVARPGVYEMPMGATFRELVYDLAGGPTMPIKALIPGGSSTPMFPFTDEYLDTPMDYGSITKKGLDAGHGRRHPHPQREVHGERAYTTSCASTRTSPAANAPPAARVSPPGCRRCTKNCSRASGNRATWNSSRTWSRTCAAPPFVPLADACAMPVQASIKYFREEYEYLIQHGEPMYTKSDWWAE